MTTEVDLRWQRSAFYRFFGLGPDTQEDDETSYTRIRAHFSARRGLNLGSDWNAAQPSSSTTTASRIWAFPGCR